MNDINSLLTLSSEDTDKANCLQMLVIVITYQI